MCACYLIYYYDMEPWDAIRIMRRQRPGSVERKVRMINEKIKKNNNNYCVCRYKRTRWSGSTSCWWTMGRIA